MATILVVDPDPDIRTFLEVTLSLGGYDAVELDDPEQLVEVAEQHRPDVILLEPAPTMNERPTSAVWDAVARLRNRPATAATPLIIVSRRSSGEDKIGWLTAGADDYISKPFDPDELLVRVTVHERRAALLRQQVDPLAAATGDTAEWDYFISHASPDKADFVRPLADGLVAAGVRVWLDDFEIQLGDSLRQRIDEGLARSRFGLVVVSPSFLEGRRWTELELNGLFAGDKRILPLFHGVSPETVASHSPTLADRKGLVTRRSSIPELVCVLSRFLRDTRT